MTWLRRALPSKNNAEFSFFLHACHLHTALTPKRLYGTKLAADGCAMALRVCSAVIGCLGFGRGQRVVKVMNDVTLILQS